MNPRATWLACLAALACTPRPDPTPPLPAEVALPEPKPEPEDERGVIGGSVDPTDFEFEVDSPDGVLPILDGTPPISETMSEALRPYLDASRMRLAAVMPETDQILVLGRHGSTTQVMLVSQPGAEPRPLTSGAEPVVQATPLPGRPDELLFRRDIDGSEDHQVYHQDYLNGIETLLTDGYSRHGPFRVAATPSPMVVLTGNARSEPDMDLYVSRGLGSEELGATLTLAGELDGQWIVQAIRPDGAEVLLRRFWSVERSAIMRYTLDDGSLAELPDTHEPDAAYLDARYLADGSLLVLSDRGQDHVGLHALDLQGSWSAVTPSVPWDVESLALLSGGRIAYAINEDGRSRLFLLDPNDAASKGARELDLPRGGVLTGLRAAGPDKLAFAAGSAVQPADIYSLDVRRGDLTRWTQSPTGADPTGFVHPRLARVQSGDGVPLAVFIYSPPGPGPHPVLVWIHGGPEDQFRPEFSPIIQFFVSRGIAVLGPNIRGSDGYGRRFRGLDDGVLRGGAIEDVGAVLDWIAGEPTLDAARVGMVGGSYGGYIVLASLAAYADRLVAGCDMVGIANLVSFLENTRGYRRDLRRAEYGDERDPDVRAVLQQLSPITNVEQIRAPLFVAHGANDPRVPVDEAEQIVAALRERGQEVWYMLAPTEGHGFRKAINRDTFYGLLATFFERHLLGEAGEPAESDTAPL
ncbi:S9 family peptidase [Enhygromyxa salina]|uniref:Prolyl endopeptidase n=1 Tax=Enhygromyxa salina TaxID=215803 RepID=A0A2S9YSK9_9BACT|nr:prolyl oligopeptidase family serine peptidase [Enhygromyxa salina]PRQ08087.1 Prolyl endopeptidase [Enhygromyxa salina]